MQRKSSLSNFCLTNVRNLKVILGVHGRYIAFAKSEQTYHLTSTDAEAAAVKIALASSQEEAYTRIIIHCVHICEMALNPYLIRYLIP